jgi:alpha-ketoglutarate-dependent taurine dioxygenase
LRNSNPDMVGEIAAALERHAVLVFRDQTLDDTHQIAA